MHFYSYLFEGRRCFIVIAFQIRFRIYHQKGPRKRGEGLELNRITYQHPVYANDVNMLGENLNTKKKNKYFLLQASGEVSLEVNTDKSEYVVMSRHQNIEKITIY
jgi:hypothetical protein